MSYQNDHQGQHEDEPVELECGEPGRDEEAYVRKQIELARRQADASPSAAIAAQQHQEDSPSLRIGVYI